MLMAHLIHAASAFQEAILMIFIQKGVETMQKPHGMFLYHVSYLPPKACCTNGNLSGGFVARSKCFVVDLPKGSMVVMCYRSKKKKNSFLVS